MGEAASTSNAAIRSCSLNYIHLAHTALSHSTLDKKEQSSNCNRKQLFTPMSFAAAMSLIITSDRKKCNEGDKEKLLTPTIPWETGNPPPPSLPSPFSNGLHLECNSPASGHSHFQIKTRFRSLDGELIDGEN